jgi:hypothetical protein
MRIINKNILKKAPVVAVAVAQKNVIAVAKMIAVAGVNTLDYETFTF